MTQEKRHHFAVAILPIVERYARMMFSWCNPEEREERTAEAVAAAFVGYVSLVNRGRDREVTAWSLAFSRKVGGFFLVRYRGRNGPTRRRGHASAIERSTHSGPG